MSEDGPYHSFSHNILKLDLNTFMRERECDMGFYMGLQYYIGFGTYKIGVSLSHYIHAIVS